MGHEVFDVASSQDLEEAPEGGARGPVFVETDGMPLDSVTMTKLAGMFRGYLQAAGIDRPQLFENGAYRNPIRVHDMRGTFISIALANGKSERWVMRRTGHTTSAMMLSAYDRLVDEDAGHLRRLDCAIPELLAAADTFRLAAGSREKVKVWIGRNSLRNKCRAEVAEWQTRRIQNPLLARV